MDNQVLFHTEVSIAAAIDFIAFCEGQITGDFPHTVHPDAPASRVVMVSGCGGMLVN
jgi:hypothetical protein